MKLLIYIMALCQAVHGLTESEKLVESFLAEDDITQSISNLESDKLLDSFLAADDIALSPELYHYRSTIFAGNWEASEDVGLLSLQDMYTEEELQRQRGGNMTDIWEGDEEVGVFLVREEVQFYGLKTPRFYDPRTIKLTTEGGLEAMLNKAANQETCGNCYLQVFVGALEISYTKATGKKVKFSKQEMTDCYFKGCSGGDFRMVAITMSYIDKLSEQSGYGEYLNGQLTCRQNATPDSLDRIRIKNSVYVNAETVEAAIIQFGSVMACMKWGTTKGSKCYMTQYQAGDLVDYPASDGLAGGRCDHAVLIVGYTPDVYIVRNSYGVTWGDQGYFLVKRGINSCGIEDNMASISVEVRHKIKKSSPNRCPVDKPKFCKESYSCTKENENCIIPTGQKTNNGDKFDKRCFDKRKKKSCRYMIKKYGCKDLNFGGNIIDILSMCQRSCDACPVVEEEIFIPSRQDKRGSCYAPDILNGVVRNTPIMKTGELLVVECNPGYTNVGKTVSCLIQDVFTNTDKDSRLMPQCIKLGENILVGNGTEYAGSSNTWTNEAGKTMYCDYWNKDVLRGIYMNDKEADKFALGNHNLCRNPHGAYPVPMCLSQTGESESATVAPVFCFQHPGCDFCQEAENDPQYGDQWCEKRKDKCVYLSKLNQLNTEFYWQNCKSTCCKKYC